MSRQIINVSEVIEHQTRWRFLWILVALSSLIVLLDGYELITLPYAAPHLGRAFDLPRAAFTPVFALGPVGNIIGGLLFGYLGDRFGRRPVLAMAVVSYSALSLLTSFATNIPEFVVLRLLSGIAVGGLIPVLWSLIIEYSPKRWRVTMVTIVMCGYLGGHALGGLVSAGLVPIYGWRILFWFGAVAPMIVLIPQWLLMPESVQHLVSRKANPQRIARLLKQVNPDLVIEPGAEFVLSREESEPSGEKFRVAELFRGRLKVITPLLWLSFICTSTTVFFMGSWTPLLAEAAGMSAGVAALGSSAYQIGGGLGSLVLARMLDKRGPLAIIIMPLLATPLLVSLGFMHLASEQMFFILMFVTGCMVLGGHHGLQAIIGLFYPTSHRSTGAGWAYGVGRMGSVLGPLVGGILLGAGWPIVYVFPIAAVPLLIFAAAILGIVWIQKRADRAGSNASRDAVDEVVRTGR